MENQAEDVDAFAESFNGVLVDTRDLFVLGQRVARDELTKEDARRMLMSAQRRFSLGEEEDAEGDGEEEEDDDSQP